MKRNDDRIFGIYAPGPRLTVLALTLIASALSVPVWLVLTLLF